MNDDRTSPPTGSPHEFHAVSNMPLHAEFSAIEPARLIGHEIIRRHMELGTFKRLKGDGSRGRMSRGMMLFSLAHHGERKQHFSGLIISELIEVIAGSVGLDIGVAYPAMRHLEKAGIVRRIKTGRRSRSLYELLMPAEPPERPPLDLEIERMRRETLIARAFDRAHESETEPTNSLSARAGSIEPTNSLSARASSVSESASEIETEPTNSLSARAGSIEPTNSLSARAGSVSDCTPVQLNAGTVPARALDRHDHDYVIDHDHDHDHDSAARAEIQKAAERLRAINFDGQRLHERGVQFLLRRGDCGEQNVANAIASTLHYQAKARAAGKPFNPIRYIVRLIRDGCTPPMTPEEKGVATQPEHRQELLGARREIEAAAAAKERIIDEAMAQTSDEFLLAVRDELAARATDAIWRGAIARSDPRRSLSVREEIFRRLQAKKEQQP